MKKIIVVDDDPSLLALVKAFLKNEYEVILFTSAEKALDEAPKLNPDLIITDVLMKEMTGYEFFVNIKRDDSPLKNIPTIVMSTRENLKYIFDKNAIVSFLPKPFTRSELTKVVSESLEL